MSKPLGGSAGNTRAPKLVKPVSSRTSASALNNSSAQNGRPQPLASMVLANRRSNKGAMLSSGSASGSKRNLKLETGKKLGEVALAAVKRTSTARLKTTALLESLRRSKFIFMRDNSDGINTSPKCLKGAANSFDLMSAQGKVMFYCKEMSGRTKSRHSSIGIGTVRFAEKIYCLLSVEGQELMRMEGGPTTEKRQKGSLFNCYRHSAKIGEITVKSEGCPKQVMIHVTINSEDHQKKIAQVQVESTNETGCSCCLCNLRKSIQHSNDTLYQILVPETFSKMGSIGKIAKFYPEVSRDLDDNVGIELPEALGFNEKMLLLASMFILYQPLPKAKGSKASKDGGDNASKLSLRN